ncbi:hypothetical protein PJ311_17970 [Bacillus sp. CLL-7-23]|uniref:Bacilysin biosynthesis protein BacA n=1 Tax=Bacillus changyiensis TaxID=3004103 RepID=A0ABT4X826_9BACI|nr:hypothetical protein [Bacillus changyiensis]MDA7028428.1 hypothetical protein [Bacillus changyiensis]
MVVNIVENPINISLHWYIQFTSYLGYLGLLKKIDVATLGPSGTSSEAAADYLLSSVKGNDGKCSLFPSYEEAYQNITVGASNILLVANAYERIDMFYMSQDIQFLFPFVFETPLYGVAKKPGEELKKDRSLTIATHHAPVSLLPWFLKEMEIDYEIIYVSSTSEAALKLQKNEVDLCLTTENAARKCNVEFISPTRPILMLWSVFIKKSEIPLTFSNIKF